MFGWKLLIVAVYAEEHQGYCNLCATEKTVTHSARVLKDDRHVLDLDLCSEHADAVGKLPKV